MSAITVGGDLVHYETLGRGRAVVLLHGWIGSWRYWVPTMQHLHLKYKVYAIDLFGFGDSAKNPRRYPIEEQIRMVQFVLDALDLKRAALIGHGLGAWIAAEIARRAPDSVARMMLISAPLYSPVDLDHRAPPMRMRASAVHGTMDPNKTIYNAEGLRGVRPLASLGRGGYDDKPASRPRQPSIADLGPGDPTIPNARLLNQVKLEEAARAQAERQAAGTDIPDPNPQNPLYQLLASHSPDSLLNRCVRRTDGLYNRLGPDVSRIDGRVLRETAIFYDAGRMLDNLRVIPVPTVLVHGQNDPLISSPDEAVWNYLTHEKEELCVPIPVPGGHFPMSEYDNFHRLLTGFLDADDLREFEVKERWRRRSR